MGQMSAEQSIRFVEATADAIARTQPEPESTNYLWLLLIAVIPILLGWWLKGRK